MNTQPLSGTIEASREYGKEEEDWVAITSLSSWAVILDALDFIPSVFVSC